MRRTVAAGLLLAVLPLALAASAEAAPQVAPGDRTTVGQSARGEVGAARSVTATSSLRRVTRPSSVRSLRRPPVTSGRALSAVRIDPLHSAISPRDCEAGAADCPPERQHPQGWPSSRVQVAVAATGCSDSRGTPYLYALEVDVRQGPVVGSSRSQGTFTGGSHGECVPSPSGGVRVSGAVTAGSYDGSFVPGPALVTVSVYRVPRAVPPPWSTDQRVLVSRSLPAATVLRAP
ncbi:hypothetical protein [Aquipuribacter sp. SD81]|uniref:hypothetical protein n=1 Tax=Aquipuribacter sp. SD81 TaxID=3127703 RepID=UPI00301A21A5